MKGALAGFRAWLVQRLTALYMAGFIVVVVAWFAVEPPASYAVWRAWALRPDVSIATFLFFTSLLLHAWVGIRDVILDYLQPMALRVPALAGAGFGLVALEAWVVRILLAA
jgi:succinate dehydrogenase / fumarate reductase membrane anchor subunit